MDKYIKQLIEMMLAAYQNRPEANSKHFPDAEMENLFADVEAYTNGDFDMNLDEVIGIPQNVFPPEDRLSDAQIDLLVPEFEALWNHFRYHLCFPEKINNRWKYILMRRELGEPHYILQSENGMIHIEFCNYDANDCEFPKEFCCGGFME
jgi:hypothetical protein